MSIQLRPELPSMASRRLVLFHHPLPWLILIALAVRLAGLSYHSLWFDEVMSTFWAEKPPAEIWRVGLALSQDKHPPLYYLALHAWTSLFGPGDMAVRAMGVLLGALAVIPGYGIGTKLGGRMAGTLGALLLALNPFLVWYSQEARMFMPATTLVLVGLYGVLDLQHSHGKRRWIALILAIVGLAAALYTYLFSLLALPVAAAWVLLSWWQGRGSGDSGRRLLLGVAALSTVTLLFLPLARAAWLVSDAESVPGRVFQGVVEQLPSLLAVYALGWPAWMEQAREWVVAGASLLALAGILVPARWLHPQETPLPATSQEAPAETGTDRGSVDLLAWGGAYLGLWIALPLLMAGLMLARDRTVFAETRYLILLVPALSLAWGRALAWLWTWRRPVGAVALAVAVVLSLAGLRANWLPENRREAWREAAAAIQQHAGPEDAILVHADYVQVAFNRYFDGPQPVFFPFTDPIQDEAQISPPLEGLAGYDAVWLVQSHHQELDPQNLIAGWFAARYPLITELYPAGIAIRGYTTHYRTVDLPQALEEFASGGQFGNLQLLACRHDPGPIQARDDLFHPPSGWVHVTTAWTATEPVMADLFPVVRLVDESGQVWGESLQRGKSAVHLWPTSRWQPGEVVRVDYDVNLNPITPPGRYRLLVEVPGKGEPVVCGEVEVLNG
jgi:hypothetical protein